MIFDSCQHLGFSEIGLIKGIFRKEEMTLDLSGKVALVTGASSGIGYRIAKCIAKAGAKVVATARNKENLAKLCREIGSNGGTAAFFQADVLKEDEIKDCVDWAVNQYGQLDIVVHCAGMTLKDPLQDMPEEDWDTVINSNLKSAYYLARHSWKYLQRSGASCNAKFVVIGSVGSYLGIPLSAAYCASKGGLVQLMRSLAVEWAGQQINVNAVCPGYVRTPLSESVLKIGETYQKVLSRIPMRRIGSTDDIANAVLFLVSSLSDYITGTTLNVDGGLLSAAYTMDDK
jgi:NAD(P)-dependent dehydrogenase (short-subunit alcohol dehydrogenase family)